MEKTNKKNLKGFTLIEILIYVFILAIIVLAVSSFFVWAIRSSTKNRTMRESLHNAERAMAIMTHEIKEARSVYFPTSYFSESPGQISLKTYKYSDGVQEYSYIDFYLCENRLCFKKEGQDPFALTSESVEVSNLVFDWIATNEASSVEISIKVNYKDFQDRPEFLSSVELQSTVSLRSY